MLNISQGNVNQFQDNTFRELNMQNFKSMIQKYIHISGKTKAQFEVNFWTWLKKCLHRYPNHTDIQ